MSKLDNEQIIRKRISKWKSIDGKSWNEKIEEARGIGVDKKVSLKVNLRLKKK